MGGALMPGSGTELFEKHQIKRVKLGTVDLDCTLRGKYVSVDKFVGASTIGFCDVLYGWDIADALYDNAKYTGWHTGFPDGKCTVDQSSFRVIPWEPGTAFFLLDYEAEIAPRAVLKRVLERCRFTPYMAAELEFFLFKETPESLRAKNFRNLTPLTPGMFGYSVLRASQNSAVMIDLLDQLAEFGVPLEGLHPETGPGVYEAAITVDKALEAAERAALFKTAVKEILSKHGIVPTFMAKVSPELPGSSGHLHQSLWRDGANLFSGGLDGEMGAYIAGLVEFLPELTALFCPTVNSYKRTVPGAWAPINSTWGIDNRTTAIRALPGTGKGARVELRLTGADINPYISMAGALAAGLEGIARGLKPGPPVVDGYKSSAKALPRSLAEATRLLNASDVARDWLGDAFVDHYVATREWEVRQFERAVTDWELARYLESI
jgi:glutamine synthetase